MAEVAARKRERQETAESTMDSISPATVHGRTEDDRRSAPALELRARLSASLPLVKDVEQKIPLLTPEVVVQATSDAIEALGLNLLPAPKRAAPAKASRVQAQAVLQRTF